MSALTVLDVLGGVLFAFLAYNSATNAAIGPFSYAAQVTIVILTLKPNMLHTGSYCYNKSRGIDLKLTMAQLPPE